MRKAKVTDGLKRILGILVVALPVGCLTVSDSQNIVKTADASKTFNGKTVAILPLKVQASVTTDAVAPVRQEILRSLKRALQERLPSTALLDVPAVVERLNSEAGMLAAFEQLVSTYESTGVIDKRQSSALGRTLNAQFLLFVRLKSEKMDIVISRGMGASLEASLIDVNNGEIVWAGTSEWKRGGIYGAGKATPEAASESLLKLAFQSLKAEASGPPPNLSERPATKENTTPDQKPVDSRSAITPPVEPVKPTASVTTAAERPSEAAPPRPAGAASPGASMSRADLIRAIQTALKNLGLMSAQPTGTVGPQTKAAIQRYQRANGLRADGLATQELLDHLNSAK